MTDISKYTVIDLDADWGRVYPLIRNDPLFHSVMASGLIDFTENHPRPFKLMTDIWSDEGAPWQWARGDGHHQTADKRFDEWMNSDKPTQEERAIIDAAYDRCPETGEVFDFTDDEDALKAYWALQEPFYPQPDQIDWLRCTGACQWLAPATVILAKLAYPDGDWAQLPGMLHTTVVCHKTHRVVDILAGGWTCDTHPGEYAARVMEAA